MNNFKLSDVIIDDTPVVINPETNDIKAAAVYDSENKVIKIGWTPTNQNGLFDLLVSNDGIKYTSVASVADKYSYVYTPDETIKILYIKVKQTIKNVTSESNIVTVTYSTEVINWQDQTDTDNDGLPDVYETYQFSTDPNKADTDGDSLPDGYELCTLNTDPTLTDTNENGISDTDEDFDDDQLNNLKEYEIGTDPFNSDSDDDSLSDYDEITTYNTDPLKYDTDGDSVSDGEEIILGLNPNGTSTNGVLDNEYTIQQTVSANDDALAQINSTANSSFKVSLDIKAAGIVANNLSSVESGYSNVMKNDAILGIIPEFDYTENLTVDDVVINFDLDSSCTANVEGTYAAENSEFHGIKRFNVFKYFEDDNILLPIETFHDVENNRVYTHVDELGTYCLVDMELWLKSLGIEPTSSNNESNLQTKNYSAGIISNPIKENQNRSINTTKDESVKVSPIISTSTNLSVIGGEINSYDNISYSKKLPKNLFTVNQVNSNDSGDVNNESSSSKISLTTTDYVVQSSIDNRNYGIDLFFVPTPNDANFEYPDFIKNNSEIILNKYKYVRIYIINYDGTLILSSKGNNYATNISQVKQMVNQLDPQNTVYDYDSIEKTYYDIPMRRNEEKPILSNYDFLNYYGWAFTAEFGYIDLCFVCDSLSYLGTLETVKDYITENSDTFFKSKFKTSVYIINYDGSLLTTSNGSSVATSQNEVQQMISKLKYTYSYMRVSNVNATFWNLCQTTQLVYQNFTDQYICTAKYCEYCPVEEQKIEKNKILIPFNLETMPDDFGEISKTSNLDYDHDGLSDAEEIDFNYSLITTNENNEVILPTLEQYINSINKKYLKNNSNALINKGVYDTLKQYYVLPTNSNPLDPDIDNDRLNDNVDPRPYSRVNNGDVMPVFSLNGVTAYINDLDSYDDYCLKQKSKPPFLIKTFDQYIGDKKYNGYDYSEIVSYTTILQQSLVYLGYLDMGTSAYGTFGGRTKAAVQTFQLNYGFQPITGNSGDYQVDYNTFLTIINVAINNNYDILSGKFASNELRYRYLCNQYLDGNIKKYNNKKYFDNIKSIAPKLTVNEELAGVTTVSVGGKFDKVYYLDLTKPIEKMFKENAKECHEYCYICILNDNGSYTCYRKNETVPLKYRKIITSDIYQWFYNQVKSDSYWDIKRQKSWNGEFNNSVRYFNSSFKFIYNGEMLSSEQLGNYMLGFTGKACGFSDDELVNISSLYSFISGDGWDDKNDNENINKGIAYYKKNEFELLSMFHEELAQYL